MHISNYILLKDSMFCCYEVMQCYLNYYQKSEYNTDVVNIFYSSILKQIWSKN